MKYHNWPRVILISHETMDRMRRDYGGLIFEAPTSLHMRLTYYHDPRIHRRIRYGPAEREYLDIYVPQTVDESDIIFSHECRQIP